MENFNQYINDPEDFNPPNRDMIKDHFGIKSIRDSVNNDISD